MATEEGLVVADYIGEPTVYDALEIVSGNNQLGEMLSQTSLPLRVRVGDGEGVYARDGEITVNFTISSEPSGTGTGAIISSGSVATDSSGYAQINLTLGDRAGDYQVTADFTGNTSGVKTFTATEKEKFVLKITGDKTHVFNLDPNGAPYVDRNNTVTITHNAASFDFKAIVDQFPTDGVNTINDWDGTKGFGWLNGATPTVFGSGATVYNSS